MTNNVSQDTDQNKDGMPSGIPFIIGNEAAERFSYYGMKAILAVFMTDFLMMTEHDATTWTHTFGSAVYFLPIMGALLSDVFLGKYRTILFLSIIYCAGHLILALNESKDGLFWGLICIAIGSGGIKPCVSAHVGDQFGMDKKHLIEKVFAYFYFAINIGAFASSLAIPYILDQYGPSFAFGLPGLLMFTAAFVFWLGRNRFVHIPPFGKEYLKTLTSKEGVSAIGRLLFIYLFLAVFWALYDQTYSTWVFQSKSGFLIKDINLFGLQFTLLPSQILAINPVMVLVLIPVFASLVYPWLHRRFPVTPLKKILWGMFTGVLSYLAVAYIEYRISHGIETSVWWQVLAYLIITVAEVLISVTALEFSYTQSPNQMKSSVMALYLFSVSMGNMLVVAINEYNTIPYKIENIQTGTSTSLALSYPGYVPVKGEKIEFSENNGIKVLRENREKKTTDTTDLSGTYFAGDYSSTNHSFTLLDTYWSPVKTIPNQSVLPSNYTIAFHRFKKQNYFLLYAALMFGTSLIFIVVSIKYKGKTYIQGEEPIDNL